MTDSKTSVHIEPYNDVITTATDWLDNVFSIARDVSTRLPNGLLSVILPPAEYLSIFHEEPIIVAPLEPTPIRAPQETQSAFTSRRDEWKELREDRLALDTGISSFRTALLRALSPEATIKVLQKESKLTIALPMLISNFRTHIATKSAILAGHLTLLEKPFAPGDKIVLHGGHHLTAHRVFLTYNEPLSASACYTYLSKSLGPCHLFTRQLEDFAMKDEADQTFAALLTAVTRWVDTATFVEANQRGYANATTSVSPATTHVAPVSQLDTIQATLASMLALATVPLQSRPSTRTQPPAAGPARVPTHYCWTHGHNFSHNSSECVTPARKHVSNATAANPQGGSKRSYNR